MKIIFSNTIKSHVLVLVATILVAGSFLASEKLAGIINPYSLTLLRFLVASVILAPLILYKKERRRSVFSVFPRALVISLFYSAFFVGLFESLNTTTSLNTGTLFTLVPLLTALMSVVFLGERINTQQILVYGLGVVGTVWVIFRGDLTLLLMLSLNDGDLIFLIAVLCMCSYSISMKLLYRNDDMIVLVFCTLVGGVLWMAIAMVILDQPLQWEKLEGHSIIYMAYLVIGATLITVYLYQKTTVVLGPSKVNAYIYLNPILVAILLVLIDSDPLSISVLPGVLLSAIATVILQRSPENMMARIRNRPNNTP